MNKFVRFIFKGLFALAIAAMLNIAFSSCAKAAFIKPLNDSLQWSNTFGNPLLTAKLVQCYPNPATTYINFKFDKSVSHSGKLFIYAFSGKLMNEVKVSDDVVKVSLDNYYRGLYVYQLRDANGNILESGKFQVKN